MQNSNKQCSAVLKGISSLRTPLASAPSY